jgi:fructose-bisphosphate aldolase class 1
MLEKQKSIGIIFSNVRNKIIFEETMSTQIVKQKPFEKDLKNKNILLVWAFSSRSF